MDIPGAPAASMPQDPIDAPVPVPPPVVPSVDVDALLNGIVTLVQSLADRDSSRDQQLAALLHVIKESKTDNDAPKPDQFNGRQSQTSAFLFQVNTAIASSPHKYDTCQKKIRFMSSRLKDTALTWYMGLLQRNAQAYAALKNAERAAMIPPQPAIIVNTQLAFDFEQYPPVLDALTTWQGFVSLFQAHFGDPDARATAERKLESLRQVTSVAEYASEYQSYCYELDDTEQRRANGFYKHLKPLVKDEVTRLGKPDTLAAMIALAIQADARLMERVSERRTEALGSTVAPPRSGTNPPRMAPFIMATPPPRYLSGPPSTHTGPVPMQVDAIRTSHAPPSGRPRGPLTASERQRRIELNLCLYCGMPHHRAESCPNRPVNSSRPPSHFVQTSSMAAHHSYAPFPHHTPPAGSETSVLYTLPAGAEQHGFPTGDKRPVCRVTVSSPNARVSRSSLTALADCGAQRSFIHPHLVHRQNLPTTTLTPPLHVQGANGQLLTTAPIDQAATFDMDVGGITQRMRLPVFNTGPYPLILGVDWLQTAHASLNFSDNTLSLSSPSSPSPFPADSPVSTPRPLPRLRSTPSRLPRTPCSVLVRPSLRSSPSQPALAPAAYAPFRHSNPVSYSAPFTRYRPSLSTLAASTPATFMSSSATISTPPSAPAPTSPMSHADWVARALSRLPKPLHRFESIFSDTGANTLPPHRPGYDFEIELEPGTTPPFGPLYGLSQHENESLRQYLDQMLANGFIQPSKSPAASPFLFAAKKGGELRPCVDYRKLNAITVKNRYPIPLTQQLVDRVRGCTVFSKIDLKNAYNLLRVAPGHEWKTAFRTRFGLYEYKVMPFGLTNAPAAFQSFIQHVLRRWLDTHVVVYLDDILLFSRSEEEHTELLRDVFQALSDAGLFANPKKCEFFVQQTEFLGFILSTTGLAPDPSKLDTIRAWPTPRSVTDVRAFLGHAGFYRRFVDDYSRIALPLTRLTRTGPDSNPFSWSPTAQHAFESLKERFVSPPVLRHFNFDSPSVLYVDASDFAVGAVLAQPDPATGVLHPCAFYSRQFVDAEINYKVYDKEMTAIMAALDHWRAWLVGSAHKLLILSDHRNLEYFTTTQQLNRRQAGWSEKLQDYNFSIIHVPGARNWADGPSRRPDYAVRKGDVLHLGQYQVLLEPSTLSEPLSVPSPASPSQVSAALPVPILASAITLAAFQPVLPRGPVALAPLTSSSVRPQLMDDIQRAAATDDVAQHALLSDDPLFSHQDGMLLYRDRVYVPASGDLRQRVVAAAHDSLPAGHPGPARTIELLRRTYDFPGSRRFVRAYVRSCDTCQRAKIATHAPYGFLQPNEVPKRPWQDIAMDFITKLPLSNGFDSVWVVVDRFSKMAHFIPCHETTTAPQLAWLFLQHIFRLHGLPSTIISDRGSVFTSQFWTSMLNLVGVEPRHSTAYHPQTDGQTERVNALLENYLRSFCSYQQDDWSSLLSFAEFSYNNSKSATTQRTPFEATSGFHPSFLASSFPASDVPAADDFVSTISNIHQELRLEIQHAQEQHRRFYDRHRSPPPQFQVGQQVWLLRRNIRTTRPMDKLDHKRLGPFVIEQRISENAFRLRLPPTLSRLHPVFNVQLLEPYIASPESMTTRPTPQQLRVQLHDADIHDLPWRPVQQILDVRKIGNRFDYLLRWHGLDPSEDSWRAYTDLSTSLEDLLRLFHRRNPNKPCPPTLSRPPAARPSLPLPVAPSPLARPSPATAHPSTSTSSAAPPPPPLSHSPSSSSSLPLPVPVRPPFPFPSGPVLPPPAPPAASVPPPPVSAPPPPTAPTARYRLRRVPRLNYRE